MTTKNKLGLFDFTMIVIGLVIGMGIFRTATDAAGAASNSTIYFGAWIAGGLVALCGALTYAEIGSRYPVTGGYYKVFSYAYHPSIAFGLNSSILISNAASVSGVALIGAGYISKVFIGPDAGNAVKVIIAMVAIFIFYGVNLMGLRLSAKAQSVLMMIKISMILLLISALFFSSAYYSNVKPSLDRTAQQITFHSQSQTLTASGKASLDKVVSIMKENPGQHILAEVKIIPEMEGRSAIVRANYRVDTVKTYLLSKGIDTSRIEVRVAQQADTTSSLETKEADAPVTITTVSKKAADKDSGWKDWIMSFGLCLIAVSFTYGGYQQTINFGNEVDKASKNIPKSIFIGITVIILLYLTVNIAYYKIIGFENMKSTREIAGVVVGKMFGPEGANVFSGLLFLSVLAYVNVSLMSNPRVIYAMSEDGVFPKVFQKKNEKRGVLIVSLSVFAAVCVIVLFFADTFEKILSFSIFLDSFGMATSAATIFMLRKRTKHLDGTGIYKMRLFPLQPIVFIAAYVFVCASIIGNTPMIALTGTAVLVGFTAIYFVIRRFAGKNMNTSS